MSALSVIRNIKNTTVLAFSVALTMVGIATQATASTDMPVLAPSVDAPACTDTASAEGEVFFVGCEGFF